PENTVRILSQTTISRRSHLPGGGGAQPPRRRRRSDTGGHCGRPHRALPAAVHSLNARRRGAGYNSPAEKPGTGGTRSQASVGLWRFGAGICRIDRLPAAVETRVTGVERGTVSTSPGMASHRGKTGSGARARAEDVMIVLGKRTQGDVPADVEQAI